MITTSINVRSKFGVFFLFSHSFQFSLRFLQSSVCMQNRPNKLCDSSRRRCLLSGFDDFCLERYTKIVFSSFFHSINLQMTFNNQLIVGGEKEINMVSSSNDNKSRKRWTRALALILLEINLQLVINRSTPIIRFNSQRNYACIV